MPHPAWLGMMSSHTERTLRRGEEPTMPELPDDDIQRMPDADRIRNRIRHD